MPKQPPLIALAELADGQEGDFFALLAERNLITTRDGKSFWKAVFRDAGREAAAPIWRDSPWAQACESTWQAGEFYKLRALFRDTQYGPQLEIRKIRPVTPDDRGDGFDPAMCLPRSRFDSAERFASLRQLLEAQIAHPALKQLLLALLDDHRETLLTLPAGRRLHHAFVGGFIEHTHSVVRNALLLSDKYLADYADLAPPHFRDLCLAGALLHDIGKLQELALTPSGAEYTPVGELIGHVLLGRDLLRSYAVKYPLEEELLLRLEHVIISHPRLAEWGAPKPPMSPEALLVHFCDDLDAKLHAALSAIAEAAEGPFTSNRNGLQQALFRGLPPRG